MDVERWLQSIPKGALDKWEAFDAVEPIGENWLQTAKIVTAIEKLIGIEYARAQVKRDEVKQNDIMPIRYRRPKRKKPKEQLIDPAIAAKQLAAAFGLKGVVEKHGNNDQPG